MAPQSSSARNVGQPDSSLKPRCALKIAVVGNRQFGSEAERGPSETSASMRAGAWDACLKVWQKLSEIVPAVLNDQLHPPPAYWRTVDRQSDRLQLKDFFNAESPLVTIVSSLAAGGDQIGAESALRHTRAGVTFELQAVLPFAEEFYPGSEDTPRLEFTQDDARMLRDLAAQARQVVRLSGRYYHEDDKRLAYRQCRDFVLHHADLVVAIYDPTKPGEAAGTREAVETALARGLTVIAVQVFERGARVVAYRTGADYRNDDWEGKYAIDVSDEKWHALLETTVHSLLALPHQNASDRPRQEATHGDLDPFSETLERLRLMSGEAPLHRWCVGRRHARFSRIWKLMIDVANGCARPFAIDHEPRRPNDAITLEPYSKFYARASDLSATYMRAYRGAFVSSFALAALAVLVAVLAIVGMLVHVPLGGWFWVVAVVTLIKIGILVCLIRLARVGHRDRYQEHAADFRYLAELLRPMQWLAPLGTTVPSVELPAHAGPLDPRRGWTPWLVRAIARSAPIAAPVETAGAPSGRLVTLDKKAARIALDRGRDEWLQGQIRYHWNTARQMHAIDDGLEWLATRLLWVVFWCAVATVVLKVVNHLWIESSLLQPLIIGLATAAAVLPAAIASLGGIMFQSEAKRLRLRSEAMYHSLKTEQRALKDLAGHLARGIPNGGEALVAAERLRALSKELIEETGHWKVLYQTHEIHAG